MVSVPLVVASLWASCWPACYAITVSSTLFDYETVQWTGGHYSTTAGRNATCKVFPGDAEWPSADTWSQFNQTLNGSLIQTVPLAASCYSDWPEYNTEQCDAITAAWNASSLQYAIVVSQSINPS